MKPGENLVQAVKWGAAALRESCPSAIDPLALVGAFAEVESAFGEFALPRHEPAYDRGGKYFSRDLWRQWGSWAACSYGSWQIMYPVAVELGFSGSPMDLWDDLVGVHWMVEYVKQRAFNRGATALSEIADCYNTGSFRDAMFPNVYVNKFHLAYAGVVNKRGLSQAEA